MPFGSVVCSSVSTHPARRMSTSAAMCCALFPNKLLFAYARAHTRTATQDDRTLIHNPQFITSLNASRSLCRALDAGAPECATAECAQAAKPHARGVNTKRVSARGSRAPVVCNTVLCNSVRLFRIPSSSSFGAARVSRRCPCLYRERHRLRCDFAGSIMFTNAPIKSARESHVRQIPNAPRHRLYTSLLPPSVRAAKPHR